MTKILTIGLDGATFDIIQPLAAAGRLPTLERLIREGASGILKSSVPPITPAAWTSFFTGKNPGRHGIFGFQRINYATGGFETVRAHQHLEKSIWEILGEAGLKSIVWDVPFTYPPQQMPEGSWMLTGYGTPGSHGTVFTSPENLINEIPKELHPEIRVAVPETNFDRSREFIGAFRQIMAGRRKLLNWLIRNREWDFFLVVFSITDTMAHVFWTFADPTHPNYRHARAEEFREAFFDAYIQCDQIIGELIEAAGDETVTLVVSDHGFGSVRPRQEIFDILMQTGYLQPSGNGGRSFRSNLARLATKIYLKLPFLREWVKSLGVGQRKTLMEGLTNTGLMPGERGIDPTGSNIIPTTFGLSLWVHDTDRFPDGQVAPDQMQGELDRIREMLLKKMDPKTGKAIFQNVHLGGELYEGVFAEFGPDLVIEYANHFDFHANPTTDNPFTEGGHTPDGIFIAVGNFIRQAAIPEISLIHLAPTILHLAGLPVPPDMDGRVLEVILSENYLLQHPVRFGTVDAKKSGQFWGKDLSNEEEEEVIEQLRKLGYL